NGCGGLVTGMVEDTLGSNGLPLRNLTSFPEANCTYAEDLNSWFVAWDTVVSSDTLTNATCYDIPLELDEAGFWVADFAVDTAEKIPGFFPVDDFRYLDEDETVLNPKFDSLTSSSYSWFGYHNYSFSMHVNATFTYIKGQYFQFRGDDDVWVFINNKLVVDLGGVHNPATGTVDLDTLGLAQGEAYDFHIFYAERNCCGSNFMMRTSINLQTVRTYYPVQIETDDGTIAYDIKQIRQEQSLACDFSSEASVDTVDAASTFLLTGPQFSGDTVTLSAGVNYGGITINSTYTGFTIDTTAIVASRTLAPGTYTLIFSLSTDATQSSKVTFVVPTYPLPTISFADSAWSLIDPSSDTSIVLGEWAFVPYKVNVQALYVGINCEDCSEELTLSTSDSLVFCLDSLCSQYTTTVTLDSGRVSFWVMGLTAVDSASFTVSSTSVENELVWAGLTFKEPPVPYARSAAMYDRDGDGMADSLILTYTASIQDDDAPDSLSWVWGDNTSHLLDSAEIAGFLANDTQAVLVDDSLVGFIATGNTDGTEYSGSSQTWFTYTASDGQDSGQVVPFVVTVPVEDHVAPVILSAEIAPGEDKLDTLYLELSESLADNVNDFDSLFTLHLWRNGVESSSEAVYFYGVRRAEGSKFILMYRNSASVYPTVGDSVRLTPLIGQDVSGNFASINNPWVAITGRQRGLIETVGLVDYDDATAPSDTSPTVRVVAAASSQTVEDLVAQEGVPGFLIRFDLGNVVENLDDADPEDVVLYFDTWFFTNLGQYVNNAKDSISCADAIFNGDCTKYSYNIFVGWNLRSSSGRLAATGAYIAKMKFVVKAQGSKVEQQDSRQMWGLRRK
ncbi:MAG TPA: fibro-slime domain-containing protein, partial [Fibrobacteraceae bacterium]|nr:fibro-slime domain-containing protein [Fibrobacteraceae bacterium]